MADRYINIKGNLYFDTKDRVIVKNMGNRYVFVRHDRRRENIPVENEKRKTENIMKTMLPIGKNLFFDKNTKSIYKMQGDKLVLYSKDRRKENKPVKVDRRKRNRI